MKAGMENRRELLVAGGLAAVLVLILAYQFYPSSSSSASTGTTASITPVTAATKSNGRRGTGPASKKEKAAPNLDPRLQLQLLAVIEQIKYDGSGRNVFVSEPDPVIPTPLAPGQTAGPGGKVIETQSIYAAPTPPPPTPIPLKFFGFASKAGEPKKIFLSKGEDVFIAGEGEIIDRRYKVVHIAPTSVEIQDVVGSGPPQSIPLTQG
jgi:hypothetical protein